MTVNLIKKVLDEAYWIATIEVAVFTGGEPTLYPEILKFGIRYAWERGFITRLVTNGWWAPTYEKALQYLRELKELGLREINVSYDSFHKPFLAKYGGLNNILNVVKAANELGMPIVIGVTKIREDDETIRELQAALEEQKLNAIIFDDFIAPVSRARDLGRPPSKIVWGFGCDDAGKTLSINPDGRVAFCCGHIINDPVASWFVTVGNAYKDSLWDIVERVYRNVLVAHIRLRGPHDLVLRFNPDEDVRHICEACYLLATKYWESLRSLATKKERWAVALKKGLPYPPYIV